MWEAFAFLIFSTKSISVFGYKVVKHLTSWLINELVKPTMLWTTGPWFLISGWNKTRLGVFQELMEWGHDFKLRLIWITKRKKKHTQKKTIFSVPGFEGLWKLKLPAEGNPGPYSITVKSSEGEVTINDVMFGDVWICSGQSNMQFTMREVR